MIKLASIILLPALAATFYSHQELQSPDARHANNDRDSLAAADRPSAPAEAVERADRVFLALLESQDRRSAAAALPVRRAIPVEQTAPAPAAPTAAPVFRTEQAVEVHEVRRAIPLAPVAATTDRRYELRQPFVTMIEPGLRRVPAVGETRASIVINGDSVVVRSNGVTMIR